jgi:small subunit ribosomal protein S6e
MSSGIYRGDLLEFKVIISEGGKTYQKEIKDEEASRLVGLRIGEVFNGQLIGESGQLQITGGTDKDGFPMRRGIPGSRRLKILVRGGPGFIPKASGERKKKRVRGDTISEDIVQINTKVVAKLKEKKVKVEEGEAEGEEKAEGEAEAEEKVKAEEESSEERAVPITKVKGIGKKTAEQFAVAGITSVQEFLDADITKLAKKTGLTPEKIEKLKKDALELVG